MWCRLGAPKAKPFPGSANLPYALGVCYPNKPDCGTFGRTCCIKAYSYFPYTCGAGEQSGSQSGRQGYCVRDPGSPDSPYLLCKACPDSVQESDRLSNPNVYNSCGPKG